MAAMKIETAEFMLGAASLTQLPRGGLPEIALGGRSNVGKSTMLNRLTGRGILSGDCAILSPIPIAVSKRLTSMKP